METNISQQKKWTLLAGSALVLATLSTGANAQVCKSNVKVLSQPRDGITLLEKYKDEFKALSGTSFEIDNLNEGDRRAKSRADASTVGRYNVYYVDEANVALFAKSKWIEPLLKHYPKDYDFSDFDAGRQKVATYEGTQWFALHDLPLYQEFAHLDAGMTVMTRLPDESTILRFRHMLEAHGLGQQILATVNAKLIDRGLMLKTDTVVDAKPTQFNELHPHERLAFM